ncbi:DMT family transporter [Embleya sp. MST-111070]|uniref:DMT family transporter n=1 Tax=Embleya sp. MST-111070 TaxID=3398231 RepID=UPI003F738C4A
MTVADTTQDSRQHVAPGVRSAPTAVGHPPDRTGREPGRQAGRERRRDAAGKAVPPLFVLLWSSGFIVAAIGVDAAPPLLLMFFRFVLAGALLGVFALVVRAPWPRGRRLGHVMVAGLLFQAVQFGALYTALSLGMSAAVAALVQGLNPVLIALLAGRVLGERVSVRQWLGFGLGTIGVVLAVSGPAGTSIPALVLAVVGLLGLSVGTVYQKRYVQDVDLRTGTAVQFLVSAPFIGLGSLLFETPHIGAWGPFLGTLAWMVLVNSIGVFTLLNLMLRRSSASRVGTLFFLTPAATALLAWLLLDQSLRVTTLAGIAIGGVGVLLANRG